MPQNVPEFRFSEPALKLRHFVYEYWCEHGHGPNLRAAHEGTALSREQIIEAYKQLDLGIMCNVDFDAQNFNLLKAPPFSSYPSQAQVFVDEKFRCYAGCAMESLAICMMPPFAGKLLRIESYCACCLAPVTVLTKDGETLSYTPETVRIHVSLSPREWNKTNTVSMCDSMNYVLDPEHAERYEKKIGRRGVLFTMEQARKFITGTGKSRMWQYDRIPDYIRPQRIIDGIRALGVDVSGWGE
jgi:Alkylmercury lyase